MPRRDHLEGVTSAAAAVVSNRQTQSKGSLEEHLKSTDPRRGTSSVQIVGKQEVGPD
jgi:hypothetical protein